MQRAQGHVRARFIARSGRTEISELFQDGSAKLRMPRSHGGAAEAILINMAGGLTGGDRFATTIEVERGADLVVTTQAAEKIYRRLDDFGLIETNLAVAPGARLDWLPQETILFDQSALKRSFTVELDDGATFLAVESVVLGRRAMGERVESGHFHDRWRIRQGDKLLFADDLRLDGAIDSIAAGQASLGGKAAMATIIYVGGDCQRYLDALRDVIGANGGASAFGGKLIARLVAEDGLALRRVLIPAISLLREDVALPKAWQQ